MNETFQLKNRNLYLNISANQICEFTIKLNLTQFIPVLHFTQKPVTGFKWLASTWIEKLGWNELMSTKFMYVLPLEIRYYCAEAEKIGGTNI